MFCERPYLTKREWEYVRKYRPISFTSHYGSVEQYFKKKTMREKQPDYSLPAHLLGGFPERKQKKRHIPNRFTDEKGLTWVVSPRYPLEEGETEYQRMIMTVKPVDDYGKRLVRRIRESELRNMLPPRGVTPINPPRAF